MANYRTTACDDLRRVRRSERLLHAENVSLGTQGFRFEKDNCTDVVNFHIRTTACDELCVSASFRETASCQIFSLTMSMRLSWWVGRLEAGCLSWT